MGFRVLDRNKLSSEFIKIVEGTIEELNLSLDDFLKVSDVNRVEKCMFKASIVRRWDDNFFNDADVKGELKFADYLAELWVDGESDDEILFNIVAHAFNGLLNSIVSKRNLLLCRAEKENTSLITHMEETIDELKEMLVKELDYNSLTKYFSICDIVPSKQYTFLVSSVYISELFKYNLCLYMRRYCVVFHKRFVGCSNHTHFIECYK